MKLEICTPWSNLLEPELKKVYFQILWQNVSKAYRSTIVYPKASDIFAAFNHCPWPDTKVVIIGQDPYHGAQQAHGLAFSVPDRTPLPPSLRNIFKEISTDLNTPTPTSGDLTRWSKQGVFLLNSTLTVEAHKPGSHQGLGWEQFTDTVISTISEQTDHVVFLLWGKTALGKATLIDNGKHLILTAPHPSPLSAYRGFFGCKHFSQTNHFLKQHGLAEIKW